VHGDAVHSPSGKMILKRKHLAHLGYAVVSVRYRANPT